MLLLVWLSVSTYQWLLMCVPWYFRLCRFVVMVMGFAFLGNLLYGPYVVGFHDLTSSFSYLLLILLGVFTYDDLQSVCARRVCPALRVWGRVCVGCVGFLALRVSAFSN